MSPNQQFWWNWWVNLGVALGTLFAVGVALFGNVLRRKWFPPILQIHLLRAEGEKTRLGSGEAVRYYHLRVRNLRRWSSATEVQVFLMRIEEPGPNGDLQVTWFGEVPLRWRHQEVVPLARTIGPAVDADLCSVAKSSGMHLQPLIVPNNMQAHRQRSCRIIASLQARANEGDSDVLRMEIAWDGAWEDGDTEMQRHLVVKPLVPERSN